MINEFLNREKHLYSIISDFKVNTNFKDCMTKLLSKIKEITSCSCVGIRLEDGEDYPYYVYNGFPESFIIKENYLCAKDTEGRIIRDQYTNDPLLECMCGNVIRGKYNPKFEFFTKRGSFWANHTTALLTNTSEQDRQSRTRNHCNSCGYESVALIPIKANGKNIGLIQLNDESPCMFTLELIEFLEVIAEVTGIFVINRLLISKLESSEQIRISSEKRFRTAIDNMSDCFTLFSAVRNQDGKIIDFKIRYVNEAMCRLFEISEQEMLSRNLLELFPLHLVNGLFQKYCNVVDYGEPLIIDSFDYTPYKTFNIRVAKCEDGLSSLWQDVTERKQADRALLLSEERFSKSFNANPSAMSITTLDEGRYIDVNEAFLDLTGYTRDEVVGRLVIDLNIYVEPAERLELRHRLKKDGLCRNLEVKLRMKNGELRYGLNGASIIDINGKPCVLGVFFDITELKKLEHEFLRLERLNLIGQMAAGIAHEVRNPMTSTRGLLQILSGKPELKKYNEHFKLMIDEIDRVNSIITDFLDLAKNKSEKLSWLSLNSIIQTLEPLLLSDTLNSNKNIRFELGKIKDVMLDEKGIKQLVLNLTKNGLEAMKSGLLSIETYMQGQEVVLAVKDEGEGIKDDIVDKIGTPFFTTKEYGTGLGLATCFTIIERHNARMYYKTDSNGTAFYVHFNQKKD